MMAANAAGPSPRVWENWLAFAFWVSLYGPSPRVRTLASSFLGAILPDHPHACGENTRFIIQVAALSWAATQVLEITAAIQSFLNVGFRSAAPVEFVVMIGALHPVTKTARSRSFRKFCS